jgi:tetratricopeptide (TPR) repeat protein
VEHQERIWFVDPVTLQDVVVDRAALESRLEDCTDLDRIWVLSLLGRGEDAVSEAQPLLASSADPFRALLVLGYAYQRLYRWRDAARAQEKALRAAHTKVREAQARHQIGRRLFDEGLYLAAAAEFDWAGDLFRAAGRSRAALTSHHARDRAGKVHLQSRFADQSTDQPNQDSSYEAQDHVTTRHRRHTKTKARTRSKKPGFGQ